MRRATVSVRIPVAVLCVATGSVVVAAALWWSYRRDCARLHGMALEVVTGTTTPSERVLAVLHWVYQNKSSRRNPHYFILRHLGATSLQVAAGGGDCADKSRLMAAMLRELDIPATMAMCFDPTTGDPAHTFVEAQVENGIRMAVDPSYCLYFPRPMHSGFHGLLDLRRDPNLVTRRVDELLARHPGGRPADRYYMLPSVTYRLASTFNWGKNTLTRSVHDLLEASWGDDIYCIRRPAVLEEPKLFFCLLSFSIGLGSLVTGALAASVRSCRSRKRHAGNARSPVAGTRCPLAPEHHGRDAGVAPDGVSVSG